MTIAVSGVATDPEGDGLSYRITGVTHGTAQLSADGQSVWFAPEAGYTGGASVTVIADDGANTSPEVTIPITVSGAPLVSLDIQNRLPRLDVGDMSRVVVTGSFADQLNVELDPAYVTWASSALPVSPSQRRRWWANCRTVC